MANLFQPSLDQACDSNGDPISGALLYFYVSGTSTLASTWTDADETAHHDNPIEADAAGRFPAVYLDPDTDYRVRWADADGTTIPGRDIDPVPGTDAGMAASSAETATAAAAAAAASAAQALAYAQAAGFGPKAVLVASLSQSLGGWLAGQETVGPIEGLYQFVGGVWIEQFTGYFNPTSNRDVTQPFSNYGSLVPFAPLSGYEIMLAGVGASVLRRDDVDRCLIFGAGFGGQSARMLRQGTNLFRDLENALCEGVRRLEELGYGVEIQLIWNQGHADADAIGDGGGADTATTTSQYLTIEGKIRDALWRAARTAKGSAISPTIWTIPLQTAGTAYPAVNVRAIQEGQRQAVATLSGMSYGPPYSQFANDFQSDLIHPSGAAIRPHGEAIGLMMTSNVSPPLMTAAAIVNSTTLDVTFNQDVAISATLAEAAGYTNDAKGFQAITSGGAYVNVTAAAMHPTASNKVRLTVATGTLSGGKVLNGQQWNASGPASDYMPRTHVIGTTDIGTALDGTVLENFSIPQAVTIS